MLCNTFSNAFCKRDIPIGGECEFLELKPALYSRAAIKHFDEKKILDKQQNPLEYNDKVIFPDKV